MKTIDLQQPSNNNKQYYSVVLVSSNGQPLEDLMVGDQTYDILQFTNFTCEMQIVDYLKKHYDIDRWKEWKYYKIFFHGTNDKIDLTQIYKKYHKFFVQNVDSKSV